MRIPLLITTLAATLTGALGAWTHTLINNSNTAIAVKVNLIAAARCKVARLQPHQSFSYSVGTLCLNTFQFNDKKVPAQDGCADQLLIINGPDDFTTVSSLNGFTDFQKEAGVKQFNVAGDTCRNHLVIFDEENKLHIESSVGPFLDFMRELGVQKIEAQGDTCVHHRLFISNYNDNMVSLWSNIKELPDYMNDGITCDCKSHTVTQARDSAADAQENLKACRALCDPPVIPHADDVTSYQEVLPARVNAYAHKDLNDEWQPNLDAITCYCANGAHFSRAGDGYDVKNNNRFCWLNCKKGWTDGNFTVDWGKAPNDAKSGDIIFRNSRGTRWTKDTVEYLSLVTIGE